MHLSYNICICTCVLIAVHSYMVYSPEDLFFLKDQVSPGDQEGPKSKKQGDRARKKGML